jgi:hypothetical protein
MVISAPAPMVSGITNEELEALRALVRSGVSIAEALRRLGLAGRISERTAATLLRNAVRRFASQVGTGLLGLSTGFWIALGIGVGVLVAGGIYWANHGDQSIRAGPKGDPTTRASGTPTATVSKQPSAPATDPPQTMNLIVNGHSITFDLATGKASAAGTLHGSDLLIEGVGNFSSASVSITVDKPLPRGWSIMAGTCCSIAIPICKAEAGETECNGRIDVPADWSGINVLGSITKADQDGQPTGSVAGGIVLNKK